MSSIVEKTAGKIRDLPIAASLRSILLQAALEAGIDQVVVTSGGQCRKGQCSRRIGSTRHDDGNAADLEIWKDGRALNFESRADLPVFKVFASAVARLGATGIGAHKDYMGPKRIHVGFGSKVIWGKGGKAANAPSWLKTAVEAGWAASVLPLDTKPFRVRVRDVLRLRAGPGTKFEIIGRLKPDQLLHVSGYDGKGDEQDMWARVDLQDDGRFDGYVFKTFLVPADAIADMDDNDLDCCDDDPDSRATVGIRNKNYLNVKNNPADPWRGSTGTDGVGHAIFDDPVFGIRAAIITLRSYWFRHDKRTIAAILARWAPATDTLGSLPGGPPNSPREYAEFVSDKTGIGANEQLELFADNTEVSNQEQLSKLVSAMAEFENFAGFEFPETLLQKALELI